MNVYHIDLHVHTDASPDGRSTLEELTEVARQKGLHAIAITDHNLSASVPVALNGVLLIPGCEVSTAAGHITGLFLNHPLSQPVMNRRSAPEDAVAAIREAGGLAILAHPFQNPTKREEDYPFAIDGVETANARAALKVPDANKRAAAFAVRHQLPGIGGSDAHHAGELGHAYTEVEAEELSLAALEEAVAQGRCRGVLVENTSHWQKGLSQWVKAQRSGSVFRIGKAAAYMGVCLARDLRGQLKRREDGQSDKSGFTERS